MRLRTPEQEQAAFNGLKVVAVAEQLAVSRGQVVALIRTGRLAAVNVGVGARPEYRIAQAALDAFLASAKVAA